MTAVTAEESTLGADEEIEDVYRKKVVQQIRANDAYFAAHLRRYRYSRIIVVVAAALVPIMSILEGTPRWVLGLLGGISAVVESLNQLYRWRDSAIAAQKMSNALEAQLNRFVTATAPYSDDADAFSLFVERIETIRAQGSDAFVGLWSEDKPPSGQPGASTPAPITK